MIDIANISALFMLSACVLAILALFTVVRLWLGKTAPDRVVAVDTLNTIVAGIMIALSASFKTVIYVDVAIVYTLLSFIATIYIANYVGEGK
ncbi:MAG: monovalent cation/H+ antiporter complex subunit F [Candidatus Woesearchaeota archaeon]